MAPGESSNVPCLQVTSSNCPKTSRPKPQVPQPISNYMWPFTEKCPQLYRSWVSVCVTEEEEQSKWHGVDWIFRPSFSDPKSRVPCGFPSSLGH